MDGFDSTLPPRPARSRSRQQARCKPSQDPSTREQIQPASPDVISSLITALSIISRPAAESFNEPLGRPSAPMPATNGMLDTRIANNGSHSSGGSFGIDYGAYNQPSLREWNAQDVETNLDELAAPTPVIRTAKPPSGLSPSTPSKFPAESGSLKTLLRGNSRPSSQGSAVSKNDASSVRNLSVGSGQASSPELRRESSSDSWDRRKSRNHQGLMYMSSKERLRELEQDKKRTSGSTGGGAQGLGLPLPQFDDDSFLAENVIGEEAEGAAVQNEAAPPLESSPTLSAGAGAGTVRFIPARHSSLRKTASATKKRASQRASHQSSKHQEDENDTIHELEEQQDRKRGRSKRDSKSSEARLKMTEPLDNLDTPPTALKKRLSESPKNPLTPAKEGAPSPTVTQRKARPSLERGKRSSSQKRWSAINSPEDSEKAKRSSSRLKRLSAPLSPPRASSQMSRVGSPEPGKDERPNSTDSIDNSVEAYLCSPRLSQKIRHPQTGRTISFSEVGDSEGFAVFCCVGMGLTRYITAFYDELALTLKLRLITPDRPGVGESEPYNDGTATPLSWPDDVYAICQALKITKFSILAHSAGAIYALATALRMPQHIRGRIHLLAPWIPPSQMSVFGAQVASPPANSIPTSQRILRALPTPILKAANSSFMSATSSSITSSLPKQKRAKRKSTSRDFPSPSNRNTIILGPPDQENHGRNSIIFPVPSESGVLDQADRDPSDPTYEDAIAAAAANTLADKERQMTYDARLTHAIWDLATSGANPAVDLLVCLERRHEIGFRYVDITRAVVIHHGSKDTRVPVENVRWLGKTMKKCEVRVLEGEGHGLMASAAVMGGVLMEIAREWDDWTILTNPPAEAKSESRTRTLRGLVSGSADERANNGNVR